MGKLYIDIEIGYRIEVERLLLVNILPTFISNLLQILEISNTDILQKIQINAGQ